MSTTRDKSLRSDAQKEFQRQLIKLRKEANMTQVELAKKLDLPQSDISRVELGERRLDVVEFVRWSNAVGFDACEVLRAVSLKTSDA